MTTEQFGKYTLSEFIGKGGMAEVYKAEATSGPLAGRPLALKRILPELLDNSEYLDLFLSEADLTRLLKHPAIVPVLDAGVIQGRYYIVMDYISGMDLEKLLFYCQQQNILLPIDFCCFIVFTIAKALAYVHQAVSPAGTPLNIVHCDVTPANIFISDSGRIFLADFGVASSIGLIPMDDHAVMGKASYMAPEQINGEQVLPATDIFALGSIFYLLLTGRSAYKGKDCNATWDNILAGRHKQACKIRPEISPELNQVVERAISPYLPATGKKNWLRGHLAGNKVERYTEAADLALDLHPLFNSRIGEPLAIASVVRGIIRSIRNNNNKEENY